MGLPHLCRRLPRVNRRCPTTPRRSQTRHCGRRQCRPRLLCWLSGAASDIAGDVRPRPNVREPSSPFGRRSLAAPLQQLEAFAGNLVRPTATTSTRYPLPRTTRAALRARQWRQRGTHQPRRPRKIAHGASTQRRPAVALQAVASLWPRAESRGTEAATRQGELHHLRQGSKYRPVFACRARRRYRCASAQATPNLVRAARILASWHRRSSGARLQPRGGGAPQSRRPGAGPGESSCLGWVLWLSSSVRRSYRESLRTRWVR